MEERYVRMGEGVDFTTKVCYKMYRYKEPTWMLGFGCIDLQVSILQILHTYLVLVRKDWRNSIPFYWRCEN